MPILYTYVDQNGRAVAYAGGPAKESARLRAWVEDILRDYMRMRYPPPDPRQFRLMVSRDGEPPEPVEPPDVG